MSSSDRSAGHLRAVLLRKILGQEESIGEVCDLMARASAGLRYKEEPFATILALGPTGVGKTDTALIISRILTNREPIRLDMSEYMLPTAITKLIGGPGEGGILGSLVGAMPEEPGTVILFDEIEKADALVLDIFLQILSAARVTLGNGRTMDLRNYVVFATSNIGGRVLMESQTTEYQTIRRRALAEAKQYIRPEILARFQLVATYNKIDEYVVNAIAKRHLDEVIDVTDCQGYDLMYDENVPAFIAREANTMDFGARDIRKAAMRIVGDTLVKHEEKPVKGTLKINRAKNLCYISKD